MMFWSCCLWNLLCDSKSLELFNQKKVVLCRSWKVCCLKTETFPQTWLILRKKKETPLPTVCFGAQAGVLISYLEKENFNKRPQKNIKTLSTFWQTRLKSELPAALESKEDKEERGRKKKNTSSRVHCLGGRRIEIQDTGRECHIAARVYTFAVRAPLKTEGRETKERGGSNLISSALKGSVLAPVSDPPR